MSRTIAKARRLAELAERLRTRPRRVTDLAREYGVSRRTIERDLESLRQMGTPLEVRDHHYWVPERGSALNEVEALAVHSATRLLVHTGVGERHYRNALEKLARQLPEPARSSLLSSVDELEPSADDRTLDLVAQAWFQGRVLRCEYRSARRREWRRHEYEIYYYEINRRNLEPYVIAYERTYAREVRVFKLSRMRHPQLLAEAYEIPADFDVHAFLAGSWGIVVGEGVEVALRVDPEVAFWFHERAGREQNLRIAREFDDGGLEVRLTGNLAAGGDAHELLSFLLGWGPRIEVLGPPAIRERVREELARAVERYA